MRERMQRVFGMESTSYLQLGLGVIQARNASRVTSERDGDLRFRFKHQPTYAS